MYYDDDDDDASVQPKMLPLDTNVIMYVNVVICLYASWLWLPLLPVYQLTALKLNSGINIEKKTI